MTILEPHPPGVPLPTPTAVSAPYWEACRHGELRFQRCANGHAVFSAAARCRSCSSRDLSWEVSVGTGTVYSYTTIWRPPSPEFTTPYVVAIVEVDDGFHMLANIVGCAAADVHIGMRVAVEFHPIGDELVLPYFAPAP